MRTAKPLLHPLDESSAAFRAVAALCEQWNVLGEGLPSVPPLAPMVLHALLSKDDALVFAAGRDRRHFATFCDARKWKNVTLVKALCAAITHNKLRPVEILFRRCIDVNQQVDGRTPLSLAAEVGNPEIMRQLLRRFPAVGADDSLTYAATNGHFKCAEMLLEAGELAEYKHASEAIWQNDEHLLRLLLSYGVAVNMVLLKEAVDVDSPQLLPILATCVTQTTALKLALQARDGQMVQMLLDTLSDTELQINHVSSGAVTALSLAIQWENVAVVKALLARGANVPAAANAPAAQPQANPFGGPVPAQQFGLGPRGGAPQAAGFLPPQTAGGFRPPQVVPQQQSTPAGRMIASLLAGASLQVAAHVLVAST
jgi:ankyrin repeat protein